MNIFETFDNVLYSQLRHNFQKRKIKNNYLI